MVARHPSIYRIRPSCLPEHVSLQSLLLCDPDDNSLIPYTGHPCQIYSPSPPSSFCWTKLSSPATHLADRPVDVFVVLPRASALTGDEHNHTTLCIVGPAGTGRDIELPCHPDPWMCKNPTGTLLPVALGKECTSAAFEAPPSPQRSSAFLCPYFFGRSLPNCAAPCAT